MAKNLWKFLINTFLVQTSKSLKKALSLTVDHLAKLTANEADADIAAIKTAYLPFHTAFVLAYNQLQSRLGLYSGKTMSTEQALEELSTTEVNIWRGIVFSIFPEGTPKAKAIFPHDRKPFYSGTYEQRIEAVFALSETLATFSSQPVLVALSSQVLLYYNGLVGTRALQQADEGSVALLRGNLKFAHETMCKHMYRNLGLLMAKYFEHPELVLNFFDTSLLRINSDNEDVVITGNVGANLSLFVNLETVTLTAETVMIFENTINLPDSVLKAQFQSNSTAALDENRNHVTFLSLFDEVETTAEAAGYNVGGGFIYLVLYANGVQSGFKITIEQ